MTKKGMLALDVNKRSTGILSKRYISQPMDMSINLVSDRIIQLAKEAQMVGLKSGELADECSYHLAAGDNH